MSDRILVTLDGSAASEASLHYMEKLVPKLSSRQKPEVILMTVVTRPVEYSVIEGQTVETSLPDEGYEDMKREMMDYLQQSAERLRRKGLDVTCRVLEDNDKGPADAIIEAEKELDINLVVMSSHGRRGITRWAYGSVTDRVLQAGGVPVLMVRACR